MTGRNVFGTPGVVDEAAQQAWESDEAPSQAPAEELTTPPEAGVEGGVPAPEETPAPGGETQTPPEPEPQAEVQPEAEGEPAPEAPQLLAGRFKDQGALEHGYRELQSYSTKRDQEATSRISQLEDALRQVVPIVEEWQQIKAGQQPGQPAVDEPIDLDDPAALNAFIERKVQERLAPIQQQYQTAQQSWQEQQMMAQFYSQGEQAIQDFLGRHAEIAGTEQEDAVAEIVTQHGMDIRDQDQLELALEILHNPAIGDALAANPMRVTSPQGRQEARLLGQQFAASGQPGPPATTVPGTATRTARPRTVAHVETGGGAPLEGPPGEGQGGDEFDKVLALKRTLDGSGNIFTRR